MSSTVRALDANEENGSTGHFRLTRELTIPNTHNLQSSCIYGGHSMRGKNCVFVRIMMCPHNCETSCLILRRWEINKSSGQVGWPSQLRNIVLSWPPKMSISPAESENIFENTRLRDIDLWPWVRPWVDKAPRLSISIVIWILSSDIFVSSTNSIQIVRRQCCLTLSRALL